MDDYAIEAYGKGYLIADYSGNRGKHGAAYRGVSDKWLDQPQVSDPFSTIALAEAEVEKLKNAS